MNFYSFADKLFPEDKECIRVKSAAQNALDYLAAKFAFQSLQSKRVAPMRRNYDYRDRLDYYESDYVPNIFGALSGSFKYDDAVTSKPGQTEGFGLWSALRDYRIPDAIHDWMITKHTDYWARMVSRYGDENYDYSWRFPPLTPSNVHAKYFNSDGSVYMKGDFEPVVQFYFATDKFINVAGGQNRQCFGTTSIPNSKWKKALRQYDALSRPDTIITRGTDPRWKSPASVSKMEKYLITMRGQREFWGSRNLATYKSFTVGYYKSSSSGHLDWPQSVPSSWAPYDAKVDFSIARCAFRIYDFTGSKAASHKLAGHYVVLARYSQNHNKGQYREYSRGFWEVVPGHKYPSVGYLKSNITYYNKESWLDNSGDFTYRLASTGEQLQFYRKYGSSASGSCNTFLNMWDANGKAMDVTKYQVNHCSLSSMKSDAGLIDVWEVNKDYQFTGRKLASGAGDGKVVIRNPYIGTKGTEIVLDSRDYSNPSQTGADRSGPLLLHWQDRTYKKQALDIGCGGVGGNTVYTVGPENLLVYGSYIYKLEGTKWVKVFGQATRIEVDKKGDPWHVNREGHVWHLFKGAWTKRAANKAMDIGIGWTGGGAEGSVFYAGFDGNVYKWKSGTTWEEFKGLPVNAERISVDYSGNPWIVGKGGSVWRWTSKWLEVKEFPLPAHDIGIGNDDNRVMITAGEKVSEQGYEIFLWRSHDFWERVGGHAQEISLCWNRKVWTVRSDKTIGFGRFGVKPPEEPKR